MNSSKIILKFERLLFNGVPDHPEHNWERDENSNVSIRLTGKSRRSSKPVASTEGSEIWGYFDIDYDNGTDTFTPANDVKK